MKTFITILIISFSFFKNSTTYAQEVISQENRNFKIEYNQQAHYPQGEDAFYSYIYSNIKYSDEAKQKNIEGNILISFDVMPDSTLSNFVVLSSPGYGVDNELIRMLKPLKFTPAMVNGHIIRQNMMMSIPVRAGAGSNE